MQILYFVLPLLIACVSSCRSKNSFPSTTTTPTLDKAESLFNINNDSAFYYFNLVTTNASDSLEIATAYTYMGIIQAYEGDYFGGQESLLTSLSFLNTNKDENQYCLLSNYHELGNINFNLKNYNAAIEYFTKTLPLLNLPDDKIIALNGIAISYQRKGEFSRSIAIYDSLLNLRVNNKLEYARILSNFAKTKWLKDPAYQAMPELIQALQIRKDSNDLRGLNASYAHLSDYYSNSRSDSALYYADKMYRTAILTSNPDDQVEALSKLIALSPSTRIRPYFTTYQHLTDSIQTARNAAKNQFALIRYEAEKNKADNFQLQKDNTQKESQLTRQYYLFSFIVIIFASIIIVTSILYKKRKQQIESNMEREIHKNQLETSQKVHDVVANGLYLILTSIEHNESLDKEQIADKLEILYEKSRNISYEYLPDAHPSFHNKLADMLKSFSSNETKVMVSGNSTALWENINSATQLQVEHILQELMINMKKHSRSSYVVIRFENQNNQVFIHYSDDGVGLPAQFKYGNGLSNTGNRIQTIKGQFTFGQTTKGVKILISFPITHS